MKIDELLSKVTAANAALMLNGDKVLVKGLSHLPPALVKALRKRREEIRTMLIENKNVDRSQTAIKTCESPAPEKIAESLNELRSHLNPALQKLSDDKLLALVNWSIMVAWEQTRKRLVSNGDNR